MVFFTLLPIFVAIADGLCEEITVAYDKAGVLVDMRPAQVKEKYGTLRFYVDFESSEERAELHKEIRHIIRRWEEKSATVCERCGAVGKYRGDLSYVLTLCDICYQQRKMDLK